MMVMTEEVYRSGKYKLTGSRLVYIFLHPHRYRYCFRKLYRIGLVSTAWW